MNDRNPMLSAVTDATSPTSSDKNVLVSTTPLYTRTTTTFTNRPCILEINTFAADAKTNSTANKVCATETSSGETPPTTTTIVPLDPPTSFSTKIPSTSGKTPSTTTTTLPLVSPSFFPALSPKPNSTCLDANRGKDSEAHAGGSDDVRSTAGSPIDVCRPTVVDSLSSSSSDQSTTTGCFSMTRHFGIYTTLCRRNALCRWRSPSLCLLEQLLALTFAFLIVALQIQLPHTPIDKPCHLRAQSLPSSGLLRYLQSTVCNFNYTCHANDPGSYDLLIDDEIVKLLNGGLLPFIGKLGKSAADAAEKLSLFSRFTHNIDLGMTYYFEADVTPADAAKVLGPYFKNKSEMLNGYYNQGLSGLAKLVDRVVCRQPENQVGQFSALVASMQGQNQPSQAGHKEGHVSDTWLDKVTESFSASDIDSRYNLAPTLASEIDLCKQLTDSIQDEVLHRFLARLRHFLFGYTAYFPNDNMEVEKIMNLVKRPYDGIVALRYFINAYKQVKFDLWNALRNDDVFKNIQTMFKDENLVQLPGMLGINVDKFFHPNLSSSSDDHWTSSLAKFELILLLTGQMVDCFEPDSRFYGFSNLTKMQDFMHKYQDDALRTAIGILFENSTHPISTSMRTKNGTLLDSHPLTITIRKSLFHFDATSHFQLLPNNLPKEPVKHPDENFEYFTSGFLDIQDMLGSAVSTYLNNDEIEEDRIGSELKYLSHPPYNKNPAVQLIKLRLPLIMSLAAFLTIILCIKQLLDEKERGMHLAIRLYNIPAVTYELAWLTVFLIPLLVYAGLTTALFHCGQLLVNSDRSLVFALQALHGLAVLLTAINWSSWFGSVNFAAFSFGIVYIIFCLTASMVIRYRQFFTLNQILLLSLFTPTGYMLGWDEFIRIDASQSGASWGVIWRQSDPINLRYTLGCTFLFGGVQICLQLCILLLRNCLRSKYAFNLPIVCRCNKLVRCLLKRCRAGSSNHSTSAKPNDCLNISSEMETGNLFPVNSTTSQHGLTVQQLSVKHASKKKPILRDISVQFQSNQINVVLGPSGAGKSTLMAVLCGLIKPSSGIVQSGGTILNGIQNKRNGRPIVGYCPQQCQLFNDLTPHEQVAFVSKCRGVVCDNIDQYLEQFNIKLGRRKRKRSIESLSFADRRKLSIALAMLGDPRVVLLDEPTDGLDAESEGAVWRLIGKLVDDDADVAGKPSDVGSSRTVVVASHCLTEANRIGNRVSLLYNNQLLDSYSPIEFESTNPTDYSLIIERKSPDVDLAVLDNELKESVKDKEGIWLTYKSLDHMTYRVAFVNIFDDNFIGFLKRLEDTIFLSVLNGLPKSICFGLTDTSWDDLNFNRLTRASESKLLEDSKVVDSASPTTIMREEPSRSANVSHSSIELDQPESDCRNKTLSTDVTKPITSQCRKASATSPAADSILTVIKSIKSSNQATTSTSISRSTQSSSLLSMLYGDFLHETDTKNGKIEKTGQGAESVEGAGIFKQACLLLTKRARYHWWYKSMFVLECCFTCLLILPAIGIVYYYKPHTSQPKQPIGPLLWQSHTNRNGLVLYQNIAGKEQESKELEQNFASTLESSRFWSKQQQITSRLRQKLYNFTSDKIPVGTKSSPHTLSIIPKVKLLKYTSNITMSEAVLDLQKDSSKSDKDRFIHGGLVLKTNSKSLSSQIDFVQVSNDLSQSAVDFAKYILNIKLDKTRFNELTGKAIAHTFAPKHIVQLVYNNIEPTSPVSMLNLLHNVVIDIQVRRQNDITNLSQPDGMVVKSQPLIFQRFNWGSTIKEKLTSDGFLVMLFMIGTSVVPAHSTVLLVHERVAGIWQSQKLTGASRHIYLGVSLCLDLVIYLINFGLASIILLSAGLVQSAGWDALLCLTTIFLAYGCLSVHLAALISRLFKSSNKAFVFIFMAKLGLVILCSSFDFMLMMSLIQYPEMTWLGEIRKKFYYLPSYAAGSIAQDVVFHGTLIEKGYLPNKEPLGDCWSIYARHLQSVGGAALLSILLLHLTESQLCNRLVGLCGRLRWRLVNQDVTTTTTKDRESDNESTPSVDAPSENSEANNDMILQLHSIGKRYPVLCSRGNRKLQKEPVLKNLSLTIRRGECFGLLGASGSGKSTLLAILAGYETVDTGRVEWMSTSEDDSKRCQSGYCQESNNALEEFMTPRQTIEFYARLHGLVGRKLKACVASHLKAMRLTEYADDRIACLSPGVRRQLTVGLAFVGQPLLVILDDPFRGIDPSTKYLLLNQIESAIRGGRQSVLIATSALKECESVCTRVGMISQGTVSCVDTALGLRSRFNLGHSIKMILTSPDPKNQDVEDDKFGSFDQLLSHHLPRLQLINQRTGSQTDEIIRVYRSEHGEKLSELVTGIGQLYANKVIKHASVVHEPLEFCVENLSDPDLRIESWTYTSFYST